MRSLLSLVLSVLLAWLLCCSSVTATHFRFGEWIWTVGANRNVSFTLNVGFRLGFFFSSPPALGTIFSPDSIDFGDGQSLTLQCRVTFVSAAQDYILGTAVFSHQYASAAPVLAVWYDSARLSAIVNAGDQPWQLNTLVTPGIPGSASLSSALPAIVTVTPAVNTFVIPVNDPTSVTFRFSTMAESYINYVPTELSLNTSSGRLTWNTNTANFINGNLYAVQVQMMHLNSSGLVDNYAPIDFLIMLSTSTLVGPTFSAPSPAAGTIFTAAQFSGSRTVTINATGATPISILAVGLPLSTADLVFLGGTPVAGQRWTTATIVFHPVTPLFSAVITFMAVDQQNPNQTAIYSLTFTSTAAIPGSGLGDPQFRGLLGQSFQVHGIDGAVYNLVSDRRTQVNARFVFLTSGKCPTINNGSTATCWSHPGSYMGELSFQQIVDGELHYCTFVSGSASLGFKSVQVDGMTLKLGDKRSFGSQFSIEYTSTHGAVVRVEQYELQLGNSDQFINVEALVPLVPLTRLKSHGLLGQTHTSRVYPNAIKYVEGEVDDYLISSNDMMGSDFLFNQFEPVMEADK